MKLYVALQSLANSETIIPDKHSILEGTIQAYAKLKRKGKSHRSVIDRNAGDVRSIQRSFPLTDDTNGRSDVGMNGIDSGNNGKVQLNENKNVKKEIIGSLLDKMSCM